MDPKASSQLDPKLQEIYDRVMGTATDGSSAPQSAPTPTTPVAQDPQTPTPNPTMPPTPIPAMQSPLGGANMPSPTDPTPAPATPGDTPAPTIPVQETPVAPAIEPTAPIATSAEPVVAEEPKPQEDKQEMTAVESTTTVKSHAFVAKSGGMKVSPVILAVGAIAFLIVYTIIWIKVFNLSVPFINQY